MCRNFSAWLKRSVTEMSSVRPKKRFSQNFIIDKNIARQIVGYLNIEKDDIVFEIGTGRGGLTEIIAESGATVFSFELDKTLLPELEKKFHGIENLQIINQDFLTVEPEQYSDRSFKLIGNIPYDITSPLVGWVVEHRRTIDRAVITVQKELGERIAAGPGSKDWAPISIFTRLFFDIKSVRTIPPGAFYPPPKVISSVLVFEPSDRYHIEDFAFFERLVRAAFVHRRKMLVKNLTEDGIADKAGLSESLTNLGKSLNVRAEAMTIEDFIGLAEQLKKIK